MDDINLITKIAQEQSGDALKELMDKYSTPLHNFLMQYVHNQVIAADLVQETFTQLFFKAHKYEPKSQVKTFIFTMGKNLTIDYLRRQKNNVHLDIVEPFLFAPVPESNEEHNFLLAAIAELPKPLKDPVTLVYLENNSYKDTATTLHCSVKEIDSALQKAKKLLFSKLRKFH